MKSYLWLLIIFITFSFACKQKEIKPSIKQEQYEISLPKAFYKHFVGDYFEMPSVMNITVIDTTAYINLVYKPKYNVITAVTNIKNAQFQYHLISNLKTRDTLESWNAKFLADTFLTLHVKNPFKDSVYQFYESYQNAIKVNVYYFDTTIYYKDSNQELAIVQINSVDIPQLNFDFLLNAEELKSKAQKVIKDLLKVSKSYNPSSDFYFFPLYYNEIMIVEYNDNNLLVISDNSFAYYGGAHGISDLRYYNIDLTEKRLLKLSDVILNKNEIKKMAFEKLSQKNIPLFVNSKTFYLTENFFILGSKITFVYNTYEIAPYYVGEVSIEFSFKEIKHLIKPQFLQKFYPDIKL